MNSNTITRHITAVLNFEDTSNYIEKELSKYRDDDWMNLVKISSHHYVLTTLYCRLKQKDLLHVLPNELENYLNNLTAINRNRNKTIKKQILVLSDLLKKYHVNHVFVKGAALISANYFEDIGERMIGDIDILVSKEQLKLTSKLLTKKEYSTRPTTFGDKYILPHQLPRFVPTNQGIAAVEIHRHVLHRYTNRYLNSKQLLTDKKVSVNGIHVLPKSHLINQAILNFEINDNGYLFNHLSLRNAYDFICLTRNCSSKSIKDLSKQSKFHKNFILKTAYYFQNLKKYNLDKTVIVKSVLFKISQKNQLVYRSYHIIASFIHDSKHILRLLKSVYLFLFNKGYRLEAWKDRKRVFKLVNQQLCK
ncbi:nucleotidyltransferase family protein [Flavobacteriaceae bacterium]|nr:nucleotidyltransferase family protein [Flavobacteriaceae bacterium]MDB2612553.1 nucleotidyltransferase family protein [Flavobacteriaceae bacterium]MDC0957716.1 nucleotidyltransferase family protein [Flavobacteriaceae bacterium]